MLRTEERIGRDQEILSSQAAWQNTTVARPVWRIDVSSGFSDTHEPGTHLDFDVIVTRIQRRIKGSGEATHSLSTIHVMILPDAHLDYPFHSVLRLRLLFHHLPSRSWDTSPMIPL